MAYQMTHTAQRQVRVREQPMHATSRLAIIAVSTAGALLSWSLSYLSRQPGLKGGEPASAFGSFAVEGMLLSLVWLAGLTTLCVAAICGIVAFRDPGVAVRR